RRRLHRAAQPRGVAVVIAGLDPAIHPLRRNFLRRKRDPRVKPAGDRNTRGVEGGEKEAGPPVIIMKKDARGPLGGLRPSATGEFERRAFAHPTLLFAQSLLCPCSLTSASLRASASRICRPMRVAGSPPQLERRTTPRRCDGIMPI